MNKNFKSIQNGNAKKRRQMDDGEGVGSEKGKRSGH